MQRPAQGAVVDELFDERDARGAQEGEPDARHQVPFGGCIGGHRHGPGVGHGVGQRLFAQHVLTRGQQSLDHIPV